MTPIKGRLSQVVIFSPLEKAGKIGVCARCTKTMFRVLRGEKIATTFATTIVVHRRAGFENVGQSFSSNVSGQRF
jgi:hypothetical protein